MSTPENVDLQTREFVTDVIDPLRWSEILEVIVTFLSGHGVAGVRVEFGFGVQSDSLGASIPDDQIVPLGDLDAFIRRGLEQGIIEWGGTSDFIFSPTGTDMKFILCNDADVHFASSNVELLMALSHALAAKGLRVYESGKIIQA
jgi:hypothetical protein